MNMMKKTLTEDYLYATCDNGSFSKEEIDFFTILVDTRTILKEDCVDIDDKIKQMVDKFYDKLNKGDLDKNGDDLTIYTFVDDLKITIYPEPENQHSIPAAYDPIANEIFLFITKWDELTSKEMEIYLEHELQHYFDLKDLPSEERVKHLSKNFKDKRGYYTDEMEFNAHKRVFIRAAEELLYRQHADLPLEKDLKKIPKRRVYDFFNFMNTGSVPIEAEWFSTLNNKQKQDLLNELLKRLTEDILHRSTKLNLCENTKLLCYYSSQQ